MGSYGEEYSGSEYYLDGGDGETKGLRGMMDHYYQMSYPQNSAYWLQGSIDKRFKAGDQSLYTMMYGDSSYYQSRRFFFNLIKRQINMIVGYQRKNRKSTITVPVHDDDPLADEYNACMKWGENRDGFHEYLSQAFEGACDTGMSLLHLYPDYTLDPVSGDLFTDNVAFNNFLIDPNFRKQDLTDCSFVWRRRWVNKVGAKSLLPGHEAKIDKMVPSGQKDGRFPLQAELLNMTNNNLFAYDEFYYRDTREAKIIIDPVSGEASEWEQDEDDAEDLLKQVLAQQPWLILKKKQVPTVKMVLCLNGIPLYHGPNHLSIDSYSFVPVLCYHEPDIQNYSWRVQGIVRNLRDAQYLYNRRKVIELDIMESQINSGWIYPVDVLTDPKALRQSGQGFLVPLKAGHLPNEIQRISAPDIPASMIELSRSLSEDITKISGVNEELLGSATDDKAGILSMLRQGAGLTTLQTIFDKLDYSQRLYGKIRLEAMRKNFSKGKLAQIIGHQPSERFFTASSLKYNLAVEEGNYSTTQRQMELQQLLHFREIGIPISNESILRAAFITNKQQVIQEMQQQSQEQMKQQMDQAQQQQKMDNADIMAKFAKSKLDEAKIQETYANIEQKQASAQHERTQADLDIVKEMIALEDMDLANLKASFDLAMQIKGANQAAEQINTPVGV